MAEISKKVMVLAADSDNVLFYTTKSKAGKFCRLQPPVAFWLSMAPPMAIKSLRNDLSEMTTRYTAAKNLYGNCRVLDPDGVVMFHCSRKRLNWYLSRDLADEVDPATIRLCFQPNGTGHQGDEYYLTQKENKCVVCGSGDNLTRHHVVPLLYRRHFPHMVKSHSYHDVLLLCGKCHDVYEQRADEKKVEIARQYNAPLHTGLAKTDHALVKASQYAHTLVLHGSKIP